MVMKPTQIQYMTRLLHPYSKDNSETVTHIKTLHHSSGTSMQEGH